MCLHMKFCEQLRSKIKMIRFWSYIRCLFQLIAQGCRIVKSFYRSTVNAIGFIVHTLPQGRSQEFCSGGASHWYRQISNFIVILQKDHFDVTGQLQQDMTSDIFYQSVSINFNKDKKTFAFAVIIIKQLLTKHFSMNIKSSGKRSAV